ncbi:hypothetical protein EHS13_02315 [Paenibacillus psychroresistens]|uniref:Uracil-DNA glycosylase-like domain-containing protein n=1 Tax=Paenibacillus psychroresistens TaxID=1778678 RepID=A0A6B8RB00_9BACL|nr:hypothetical protein [Paenibacillus psychroresistens]QGQ93821.1 hypothetical protein EHS13_02315 [Paenibacillus psychroresistens]
MTIKGLSKVYEPYCIFPAIKYLNDSPVKVFQRQYPSCHYSHQIQEFLTNHNYPSIRKGADLPWWGKHYFSTEKGKRVFIIAQDSKAQDAGSVVFFAHLLAHIHDRASYTAYNKELNLNQRFRFASWNRIKQQLSDWELDLDFVFITDASKVYEVNSDNFNKPKSRELLLQEIEFCDPDLLILLGGAPLSLLRKDLIYSNVVECGEFINIAGKKAAVSPFPSGNGLTQPNFELRKQKASELIKA